MTVAAQEKNRRRRELAKKYAPRRAALKKIASDSTLSFSERLQATSLLDKLPRNSSWTRVRNRCLLTGRPRGFYRKFLISRIKLRELASNGELPGVTKASW